MIALISNNIDKIQKACRQYHVQSLYLFGSAATGNLGADSDVDFLVSYPRDKEGLPVAGFDYFDLLFQLEEITGKKVDLVIEDAIQNEVFKKQVNRQKQLIYEA